MVIFTAANICLFLIIANKFVKCHNKSITNLAQSNIKNYQFKLRFILVAQKPLYFKDLIKKEQTGRI